MKKSTLHQSSKAAPGIVQKARLPIWRPVRIVATVAVGILWLVATNFCALASADHPSAAHAEPMVAGHSHGSSHGSDHGNHPSDSEDHDSSCCASLQVPTLDVTAIELRAAPSEFWLLAHPASLFGGSIPPPERAIQARETGPPDGSHSFAEAVLQRSLPAHAPPAL